MMKADDRRIWNARGASLGQAVEHRIRSTLRRDGPLFLVCASVVAFGIWLRMQNLGFPRALTFDERHFVLNARNYLARQHDWNDHPPLSKLLFALSIMLRGDNSVGWRSIAAAAGLVNIVLAVTLGRNLFRDRRAGWLAGAFVAGDGFLIAYSRTALPDGILAAFVLAAVCLVAQARSPRAVAAAAIAAGCAASIKLSGFALAIPLAGIVFVRTKRVASLGPLVLIPATYAFLFALGLAIAREPYGPARIWHETWVMLAHHAVLTDFKNPASSRWYTWFLPLRPILLRYDLLAPDDLRAMSTLGNLVSWWLADVMFVAAAIASLVAVVRFVTREPAQPMAPRRFVRSMAMLFASALAMLLPWIFSKRDSYIYHYLPSYSLLLVLVGAGTSRLYRRHRRSALVLVTLSALTTVFYAPIFAQLRLTPEAYRQRLFWSAWR